MEQEIRLAPVRLKIEEGAKGEVKVTVAIDGEDEEVLVSRIMKTYTKLKQNLSFTFKQEVKDETK